MQEQLALIDERQKYEDAQESDLNLAKARLGLLRALGHMQDWLSRVPHKITTLFTVSKVENSARC